MISPSQSDAESDLNKTLETLLAEIYDLAHIDAGNTLLTRNTLRIIPKFSCILIKVSRAAERQSRSIVILTWALLALTFALFLRSLL